MVEWIIRLLKMLSQVKLLGSMQKVQFDRGRIFILLRNLISIFCLNVESDVRMLNNNTNPNNLNSSIIVNGGDRSNIVNTNINN